MVDRASETLPCIWVLAGVLSYRLCDQGYDCEHCALFHALRGGNRSAVGTAGPLPAPPLVVEDPVHAYVCRLIGGCELHLDRAYSPGHFWIDSIDREQPDQATLGLDGHVWRVLHPVDDVVLPRVETRLKRGGPCGWIERRHMVVPLTAPVAGEVLAVNDPYLASLREQRTAGDGEAWLLRLRTHESPDRVPDLLRGEDVLHWYLAQVRLLRRHLEAALTPAEGARLGRTLNDGGAPQPDLEAVVGSAGYQRLVDEIFYTQN